MTCCYAMLLHSRNHLLQFAMHVANSLCTIVYVGKRSNAWACPANHRRGVLHLIRRQLYKKRPHSVLLCMRVKGIQ